MEKVDMMYTWGAKSDISYDTKEQNMNVWYVIR